MLIWLELQLSWIKVKRGLVLNIFIMKIESRSIAILFKYYPFRLTSNYLYFSTEWCIPYLCSGGLKTQINAPSRIITTFKKNENYDAIFEAPCDDEKQRQNTCPRCKEFYVGVTARHLQYCFSKNKSRKCCLVKRHV